MARAPGRRPRGRGRGRGEGGAGGGGGAGRPLSPGLRSGAGCGRTASGGPARITARGTRAASQTPAPGPPPAPACGSRPWSHAVPAAVPRAQGGRRTRRQPIAAGLAGPGSRRWPRDSGEPKASSGLGPGRGGAEAAWPASLAGSQAGKSGFRHSAGLRRFWSHRVAGRASLGPRPGAGGSPGASGNRSWFGSGGTRGPGLGPGLGRTEAEMASETWPVLGQRGWEGATGATAAPRGGVGGGAGD